MDNFEYLIATTNLNKNFCYSCSLVNLATSLLITTGRHVEYGEGLCLSFFDNTPFRYFYMQSNLFLYPKQILVRDIYGDCPSPFLDVLSGKNVQLN